MFTKLVLGKGTKHFASLRKAFFNPGVFRLSSSEESTNAINDHPTVKLAKEQREMLLKTLPFLDKDISEWKEDGHRLKVFHDEFVLSCEFNMIC
jgi:hypothetical protein